MKFVQELLYAKYMPSIIEYWYSYIKLDIVFFKLSYSKYTDNRMSRRDTRFRGTVRIFLELVMTLLHEIQLEVHWLISVQMTGMLISCFWILN